jgi:hypothetical protein
MPTIAKNRFYKRSMIDVVAFTTTAYGLLAEHCLQCRVLSCSGKLLTSYKGMAQAAFMESGAERGVRPGEHEEGTLAKLIEEQTSKLPSDVFLWAAVGSMVGSLAFQLAGHEKKSVFIGQWAPTFLILGLYNKLVRVAGSD